MNETVSLLSAQDRRELQQSFGEHIEFDVSLAALTWWQVGGPADALIKAIDPEQVVTLLQFCRRRQLPYFVLGHGSNLLVGDGGMRGIVVRLGGSFERISIETNSEASIEIVAGGAASLALLVGQAASRGALGCDGLAGVPATVGGAIRMNAGTEREIGEFAREVLVQTLTQPEVHPAHVTYAYRQSTLAPDAIVAQVRLVFAAGQPALVRAALQERLVRRKATQPVGLPNAGSCFRNPPGDRAGRLIESIGAKGWRVGGAEVSALHANFIVNSGAATAEDIAILLARVRSAVYEQTGIGLELEVHFVGAFTAPSETLTP